MNIFQYYSSSQHPNTSSFSSVFLTAKDFQQLLCRKSYLLHNYLSMFFRLITKIDFCNLEEEVYDSISKLQKKIRKQFENNPLLAPDFECQEFATQIDLCWITSADSFLEEALLESYDEYIHSYHCFVDLVDMRQTEERLAEYLGRETWKQFQQELITCFLPCTLMQLFRYGVIIEITKHFFSRDLETDQEIFRLYLNHFFQK